MKNTTQFQNLFENWRNRAEIDAPVTHITDCPPAWLGTGTSYNWVSSVVVTNLEL